jgi:hypothetical protein
MKSSDFCELTDKCWDFTKAEHFLYWVCLSPFQGRCWVWGWVTPCVWAQTSSRCALGTHESEIPHASEIKDNCCTVFLWLLEKRGRCADWKKSKRIESDYVSGELKRSSKRQADTLNMHVREKWQCVLPNRIKLSHFSGYIKNEQLSLLLRRMLVCTSEWLRAGEPHEKNIVVNYWQITYSLCTDRRYIWGGGGN